MTDLCGICCDTDQMRQANNRALMALRRSDEAIEIADNAVEIANGTVHTLEEMISTIPTSIILAPNQDYFTSDSMINVSKNNAAVCITVKIQTTSSSPGMRIVSNDPIPEVRTSNGLYPASTLMDTNGNQVGYLVVGNNTVFARITSNMIGYTLVGTVSYISNESGDDITALTMNVSGAGNVVRSGYVTNINVKFDGVAAGNYTLSDDPVPEPYNTNMELIAPLYDDGITIPNIKGALIVNGTELKAIVTDTPVGNLFGSINYIAVI